MERSIVIPTPTVRPENTYEPVPVYFDGLLHDKAYLHEGCIFISPQALCDFYALDLSFETGAEGLKMSVPGLELLYNFNDEYMLANSRYLYAPLGYLQVDGKVYLPLEVLERCFGLNISCQEEPLSVNLSTTGLLLLSGGQDYYDVNFPTEDVHWLSRIIYAEAGNQPLAGMIGVGNVVLNRVQSDDFADTIFDVIFARDSVVQFVPSTNDSILEDPSPQALIAAYLCLEGFNTVGDSLYFVNPDEGDSWFRENLSFVASIGNHDFYA